MNIPKFLDRDNYLQNPIMRRFLKARKIELVENRADYIAALENYANKNTMQEQEVRDWLLKVVREGSKEICYKKISTVKECYKNPVFVDDIIKKAFPSCPMRNILNYHNTGDMTMIEYHISTNENGEVKRIEFTFSNLFLYGEVGKEGNLTVFPVFIEVYLDEGFVISRGKAKSTLYQYDSINRMLFGEYRVDTMDHAVSAMDKVTSLLELETEIDAKKVKNSNFQMLYKIYDKYSFTPEEVVDRVNSQNHIIDIFVDEIFRNLELDIRNKEKALLDIKIFVEKFISINGNNENIFKNGRAAYLIKVSADDETELTKIDTTSDKSVPLQCTEAFFDSKKSVVKSKTCKRLNLIFKRKDEEYFSGNPLVVQLGTHKNYGYVKTMQYAEEADIQNVLQAIFENY